jgi:hypothetical protein
MSDSGSLIEFQTDEIAVLSTGTTSAYFEATAIVAGTTGNVSTGAISIIRTPIVGISSCTNDAAFSGGTDQESDTDLRERVLYTIWVNGRATIPLMEEHINAIAGVREAHVETLSQGDALIVIDAEDELINDIDEIVRANLAAGCTAPGVLGASIRYGASSFEIGDCSGAPVWVRNLQFTTVTVEVSFTYQEPNGATKDRTVIIPGGSPAGVTVQASLDAVFPNAVKRRLGSIYAGILSFDIFMGKGIYPRLWVAPELQAVDIALELVLIATPEVGLKASVKASLEAKLASYKIGEDLEFADLVKYIYIDYATVRAFSGIDDVSSLSLTCKGSTITSFGQKVTLDDDERIGPGTVTVSGAT